MKKHNLALNYLHVFIILLVVAFHSVIAYEALIPVNTTPFTTRPYFWAVFPILDIQRWIGFTLFVVFNDQFFMPLLFFISGLFIWPGIINKGSRKYLYDRIIRLGIPFVFAKVIIIPLGYYASYLNTGAEAGLPGFYKIWISLENWPSGPAWFLILLIFFDFLVVLSYKFFPGWGQSLGKKLSLSFEKPFLFYTVLVAASAITYFTMITYFDRYQWSNFGPLNFQTTRVLLYAVYLVAGIAVGSNGLNLGLLARDGRLARRWPAWFSATFIFYLFSIIFLGKHLTNPSSVELKFIYAAFFILFCAACLLFFIGLFVRMMHRRLRVLDSLHENAYGIFLFHYPILIWLQYYLLNINLSAITKGFLVTAGAVSISWLTTAAIRRIPAVNRVISPGDSKIKKKSNATDINLAKTEISIGVNG